MKVDLVEATDYLKRLVEGTTDLRGRATVATVFFGGSAVAFLFAQGALEAATGLVPADVQPFLGMVRGLALLGVAGALMAVFVAAVTHDILARVVREATAVRYIAAAERIEIALPAGDAR